MRDINDDDLISKSYFSTREDYNYDLIPLINENFDFDIFIKNGRENVVGDNGGFLVITDNQYVLGYNRGMGTGGHMLAFARVFSEINGGTYQRDIDGNLSFIRNGKINKKNVIVNSRLCSSNNLTASIIYEPVMIDDNGYPIYYGYIFFHLADVGKITLKQFNIFEKFYNDYNEEIKRICRHTNNFNVGFNYVDDKGQYPEMESKNLDMLYEFLKNNIDNSKNIIQDKNIIGVSNKRFVRMKGVK